MADAKPVHIEPLAEPILARDDLPEEIKAGVRDLTRTVESASGWAARRGTLLDLAEGLDAALAETAERPEPDDDGEPEADVMHVLPAYVAAILECLDERVIGSADQAACYVLSAHPEHQDAALAWIGQGPASATAFEAVLGRDRRYAAYFARVSEAATGAAGPAGAA
jgi:hypothetical protein